MPLLNTVNKNLKLAYSTKSDGNMSFKWGSKTEVLKNRKKWLGKIGITPQHCVAMSLLHGTGIKQVDSSDKGQGMLKQGGLKADCLICTEKGLFLFVLTADCLPVIFYDPKQKILALAHISRKNTGQLFAYKIVKKLIGQFNCQPVNLIASIGPAIHKESYIKNKVPEQRLLAWQNFLLIESDGQVSINLIGYNKEQMIKAGIQPKNIYVSNIDTAKSKHFFSHRRSQNTGESEGRLATVVGMI